MTEARSVSTSPPEISIPGGGLQLPAAATLSAQLLFFQLIAGGQQSPGIAVQPFQQSGSQLLTVQHLIPYSAGKGKRRAAS